MDDGANHIFNTPPPKQYQTFTNLKEMINGVNGIKFAFAVDNRYTLNGVSHENKNYFHLKTLTDVLKVLETDKHIYEIIFDEKKKRKLYYDFDGINYTREEADIFIETFIKILNTELNIKINHDELIVLRNENKTKSGEPTTQIQSLHIIITNYKASGSDQLNLARFINEKYDDINIDENVYKKNQLFRMINQSKMKYGVRLVNYYDGDIDIKKSLINHTLKCIEVSFEKLYAITEYFNDLKDGKPLTQIPKDQIIEYIIRGENDISTFDRDAFFNNNIDWKTATMILVKRNLYNANKWNTESVNIANNDTYTIERNANFITKINAINVKSGLTKLYKIVSKYSTHNIYSNETNVKSNTIDFLKEYYDDDTITSITENIVNVKTTKKMANGKAKKCEVVLHDYKTKTDVETQINVKNGFITFKDNRSPVNMFYDNLPRKNEKIFEDVETILDAKNKTIDFVNSAKKIMILKSRWGTGKTSNIITYLLEAFKNHKILLITESNTLNSKLTKDFDKYGFVSHIDAQKDKTIKLKNYDKVICSIQSIGKINDETYDLVIIDEFESVLTSYTATPTFKSAKTTPHNAFNILINIIKRSEKTLFTDADISEDKVAMIENIFGRSDMTIVKNNQRAFENVNINIITARQPAIELLTYKLYEEDKKIAVASASKRVVEMIVRAIRETEKKSQEANEDIKKIKIMKVQYEGVFVIENGVETKYDKDTILQDVETFIIENNIQLFCYSPTIKTGVSINSSYFDITFGFASSFSVLYNEFLQMIFRARRLNDNEIIICVKEDEFKNTSANKTIERVKQEQHTQKTFYEELVKDSIVYSATEVSDEYYEVQSINNMNAMNSKYNYTYNMLQLIQYHQLNYHYTTFKSYEEQAKQISEYSIDILKAMILLKAEQQADWLKTPLYNYKRYTQLALQDKQERDIELDDDEIKQFAKTSLIYGLFKVKSKINHYIYQLKNIRGIEPFEPTDEQYKQIQIIIDEMLCGCDNDHFYINYVEGENGDKVFGIHSLHHDLKDITYHFTKEDDKIIDKLTTEKLLNMFGVYDFETRIFTPKTYTNKQLKLLLIEHLDWIKLFYNKLIGKENIVFDIKNKFHLKSVYHGIKDILKNADIHILYEDTTNTTRDYDKFTIMNIRPDACIGYRMPFYKYKMFNESSTLNHIPNKAKPQTFTINKDTIYSCGETTKKLNKTRNTKKELLQLQLSSLYHEASYINLGKINGVETFIRSKTIEINQHFHNELLYMKTIENKIVLNDDTYDVICKKDDFYIMTDKRNNRKQQIFKYFKKNNIPYYKPYEAVIPIINTKPNPHYEQPNETQYAESKNQYENSGEETMECYEDEQPLNLWEYNVLAEEKPTTINESDECINENDEPDINTDERDNNRKIWATWEYENRYKYCDAWKKITPTPKKYNIKLSHHEQALVFLLLEDKALINNLNINTPLMDEIKQTNWTLVLGY